MGILKRGTKDKPSRVRTAVVKNTRRPELTAQLAKHVEDGSTIYTDAVGSYRNLDLYYRHGVVDHAVNYVDGLIHTNGCDNSGACSSAP